ncbi:IS110 family transposase [Amycolatopsis panacis]|uniref:IS110 family transposase n=1 Tax=Amycolatopsis panacis TaxID=2340917 RepID=A0A419IA81_9PSEU|nr:IS110 family transposase [Amycolatopsis panacis]
MEGYAGPQFVGIDLHRRRGVIVRMTEAGEVLETTRIVNDAGRLVSVLRRCGEAPEVVVEATCGWYWAADVIAGAGARLHVAHPLGVKAFEYRRVKNDERDAADLADLLRMGRLPEAWIAPPVTRELRELVRHRAKLVALRSHCRAEIHAVLATCGVQVPMTDLFGVAGIDLLNRVGLPGVYRGRIDSLRRLLELLEFEIDVFTGIVRARLSADPGYVALQTIPGIGPVLAAVFVAEIADVHRFAGPDKLACWCGLTPKHHESDTHVHRGAITKQGSRLVRWAAVESVQVLPATSVIGAFRDRIAAKRGRNIGAVAAARKQIGYVYYALRDHHVRALHATSKARAA